MELPLFQPADDMNAAAFDPLIKAVNLLLTLNFADSRHRVVWGDVNVLLELNDTGAGGSGSRPGGFMCEALSNAEIRVYLGLVNSTLPEEMTLGDVEPFSISPAGESGYVCLEVEVYDAEEEGEAGTIKAAAIKVFSDQPDDTGTKFYLALGTYGTDDGKLIVTPGGDGNGVGDQSFELCGGLGGTPKFWRA